MEKMQVEVKEIKNDVINEVTTVYDRKSGVYMGLQPVVNNAVAIRAFQDSCAVKDSMFSAHPEDYDLVNIGKFNINTGKLIPGNVITLANATQFVKRKYVTEEEK